MSVPLKHYQESAAAISSNIGDFSPEVALILGSGLGFLGDLVEKAVSIPYETIPHFRSSTAPGHQGRLVFGYLQGKRVAVMQGRIHYYEGYSHEEVAYPLRVLHLLGAKTLFVTNAAGAVNLSFRPGGLMLITDHIKLYGDGPLRGENVDAFGPRFPDASFLYTKTLRRMAKDCAKALQIPLEEGVYMYFPGPQYETPAEIRAARVLGADAVGMSTVPEVIAAAHCGMQVLGFTLLSNMAAGILEQPLSEREVLEAGAACQDKFSKLVLACLNALEA
ncbi:MAG: purine-nucleoside phosphorylase [Oscillospiraceae bacterium]|jgi:purine-nucleoside phosphorylase